jgi:hypothetical protein
LKSRGPGLRNGETVPEPGKPEEGEKASMYSSSP